MKITNIWVATTQLILWNHEGNFCPQGDFEIHPHFFVGTHGFASNLQVLRSGEIRNMFETTTILWRLYNQKFRANPWWNCWTKGPRYVGSARQEYNKGSSNAWQLSVGASVAGIPSGMQLRFISLSQSSYSQFQCCIFQGGKGLDPPIWINKSQLEASNFQEW